MYKNYSAEISLAASKNIKESEYWLKNLSGELVKTNFPYDHKKTNIKENYFDRVTFVFPGTLFSRVMKIVKGSDVRLHVVLVAGVVTLLNKYSGINDIIVGTPVYRQEIEGNFINTLLVLRNRLKNHITFKELLLQVRQTIVAAAEHQNYPIETLLYKLDIPFSKDDTFPLFDVVVLLENIHDLKYILHTNPNIIFSFTKSGDQLKGAVDYNASLYEKSSVERIVSHFLNLLQDALFNIDSELTAVEFLSQEEREQLLVDFNDTGMEYPDDMTLTGMFEQQVERTPDRSAVVFRDRVITYRKLGLQAGRLARRLKEPGITPGAIVAVMEERSIDMIVDIWGILTAGGAYLPLDLNYPEERILYTLRDCEPSVLLVGGEVLQRYTFTSLKGLHRTEILPRVTASRVPVKNLDTLPMPDRSLIDMEKYTPHISLAMVKGCMSIQATRGCPYDCAYCAKLWPKNHVVRSAENIFAEVKLYYDMGIRRFSFIDDIFNLNVKNSARFFELVIENKLDIQILFPAGLRGDIMTKEYIDLMVKAGTINISVALETASPRLQKLIKKNLDIEKLWENLQYICKTYPHVILDLFTMHGFPSETEAEALMTLDFIKSLKWLHFPLINILKIYPNTDMEKLALANGITREAIVQSENAGWHEFSSTLPFDKNFTSKYQSDFLNDYFLLKERLLHVLPYQMKALTEDELVTKYNSYLSEDISDFDHLLGLFGIKPEELSVSQCADEKRFYVPNLNEQIRKSFPKIKPTPNALRVLLLDLSHSFSGENLQLEEMIEAPLGLIYLMTWLKQQLGSQINGKIAKSGIDFDNYSQLYALLQEFKPDVIGIRTLTFYKEFFHRTVSFIKQWRIDVPVIVGGPYATNSYLTLLQDGNIDMVVFSEGEVTFTDVIEKIMECGGKLPGDEVLGRIPGIAFIPREKKQLLQCGMKIMVSGVDNNFGKGIGGCPERLTMANQPVDPAYVIYTSGSSGFPKGVMIHHRSVINLVFGLDRRVYKRYLRPLGVAQLASPSFDGSVKQIFAALLLGHTLDIVPEEVRLDGSSLLEFYKKHQIEVSDGTPIHMNLMVDSMSMNDPDELASGLNLKHLIIGGEILPKNLVETFYHWFPGNTASQAPVITNVYGPTECTVDATSFEVTRENLGEWDDIPIGKPISNVEVFILNRGERLLPVGVPGELHITGDGVARGYLNRLQLTAEKFIEQVPGALTHGGRFRWENNEKLLRGVQGGDFLEKSPPGRRRPKIYKTGDLGRWLVDGNIQFLGRVDRQVKIRGYRIELEEIENQLRSHRDILDTAVLVRETPDGDQYICAYVVSTNGFEPAGIRKYLNTVLPLYMMPGSIVLLERIPLTPNGKVDKRALPEPEPGGRLAYAAPADEVEKRLARLWSEVLLVDESKISRDTDFFEIGGHSLKSVVLISKIHKELDVKIPVAQIFKIPTIKGMGQYIKGAKQEIFISIENAEKKEYYPLSSPQKRLYILQQMDTENIFYNIPYAVVLEGDLDRKRWEGTFKKLVKRQESLRTSFEIIEEEPVQRIHDGMEFEIEYHIAERKAQSAKRNEERYTPSNRSPTGDAVRHAPCAMRFASTIKDFIRPFDLSYAPLLRVGLIKTGEQRHILMVDMHHIVTDGISTDLFVKEFMDVYAGKELSLSRLQYKDYSVWQNSEHHREAIGSQEHYWLAQFQDEPPVLRLPTDYSRPPVQGFEGSTLHSVLTAEQTRGLRNLALDTGTTLYMVLSAVYNVLLSKLSGQEDIVVGAPIAARRHVELEKVIGMFVNILPIRNNLEGVQRFRNFLAEVKYRVLSAFENQEHQFEDLVEKVTINRDVSRNPLFDVTFLLQHHDTGEIEIPGLKLKPYKDETLRRTSKYDLSLTLVEGGEGEGLLLTFEYSTKLFKKETIQRFLSFFKTIVSVVIHDPDTTLGEIEIISGEEKRQILYEFNDTGTSDEAAAYLLDKTIHQLFEAQVERTPDCIAVVSPEPMTQGIEPEPGTRRVVSVSYKELNKRSNKLARLLRSKGVNADAVVGVMMGPSIRRIVALLAVLKVGAGYLPIDPTFPVEPMVSMLEDCQASLLLSETGAIQHPFTVLKSLYEVQAAPGKTRVRPPLAELDNLPFPDRSLVNYDKYMNRIGQAWVKHNVAVFATRGCPYKCAYCHNIWPKKHVVRSAENIFAEVKLYYDMGVRRLVIIDDIFNLNIKNSRKFFRLIIEEGLKVQLFFPNGMRGDLLTRDYIDLMVKAGTVNVALALETASPRLQKMIGKNLNIAKFRENLEYLCETYPHVISELFTIHGFPTETPEEARMTLDFIKSIRGIHFPYINILRIYSNTPMHHLALESGISSKAIFDSENLYFHEIPETLPFSKGVTRRLQGDFLNSYFLSKERLLHVLPYQMKIFSRDEMVQKYNSYLAHEITDFSDLLRVAGITEEELGTVEFLDETSVAVPGLYEKMRTHFPAHQPDANALRVLLLDLSQFFSADTNRLDNLFDPPLGLLYVMTYLNCQLGSRVHGRIAKSRVDFDHFSQLKALLEEFKPDIIGIRTLTYYRDFFHQTAALIRQWGFAGPIVTGGPYATSNYNTILQDRNIDLAILGEGEVTFCQLVEKMLENGNQLPGEEVLKGIPGLAFLPGYPTQLPDFSREIVMLDESSPLVDVNSGENLEPVNQPGNLAYVMFTSGSSGKPKGVLVEHRNVVNNLYWFGKTFKLGIGTHLMQLTDYNFDPSVEDIFGSLVHGATLYVVDKELGMNREKFRQFVNRNRVHIIDQVPMMLDQLLGTGERLESLRVVISGGMPLEEAVKNRLINKGYPLYNNYGPTEITVDALFTKCSEEKVTLGHPIFNVRCYVLDRYQRLVPIGVAGELCVAGAGVARGYINNPELTAEKFCLRQPGALFEKTAPGPRKNFLFEGTRGHAPSPHHPIYMTGDRAKWQPDGTIQFLGRMDRQVKVRGYRIELKEIEHQLRKYDKVNQAVVLAKSDNSRGHYLCAYFTLDSSPREGVAIDPSLDLEDLKNFLSNKLPFYMIPTYFFRLEKIPLSPGGKVNRSALLSLDAKAAGEYAAPRNALEKTLVRLWSEVLAEDMRSTDQFNIGIDDNFFELGGHSLKATILVSKIHKTLDVQLPLTKIFKHFTVRELAKYINTAWKVQYVSIEPVEKKEYYPLYSAQKRLYFFTLAKSNTLIYNIPSHMELEGELNKRQLQETFQRLIQRHESFRTAFELVNGEPAQRIHDKVEFKIDYYNLKKNQAEVKVEEERPSILEGTRELAPLYIKSFIRSFDLSQAPLLRVGLITVAEKKHILMMNMHHIISDGFSVDILVKEFFALYSGQELSRLRLQYRDFSGWWQKLTEYEDFKRQESHWLNQFKNPVPVLNLPVDYPRPSLLSIEGDTHSFQIHHSLAVKIRQRISETKSTLYILLLAVYYVLLMKYTGQEDIVVGTVVAGRRHADLENIIGLLVNMLAMRNHPQPDKTFMAFLEEVRENTLLAFENQDYPVEELVKKVKPTVDPSRNPLFDTVFQVQNLDELEITLPGLVVKLSENNKKTARYDLLLFAYEKNNEIFMSINYCAQLFNPATIRTIANHFVELLEQLLENPGIQLKDVAISSEMIDIKSDFLDDGQGDFKF